MNRFVVIHHNTAWWRSHRATSRCPAGRARRQRSGRGGKRVAWATPFWVMVAAPKLQPAQKTPGQHHRHRMPVEAWPQPALILIPASFLFGLLMERLNGMPTMGISDQLLPRRRGWQVAPGAFVLLRLPASRPLPQQPADAGLALRRKAPGPDGHTRLAPPSLGPGPPADGAPLTPRHRRQHLVGP